MSYSGLGTPCEVVSHKFDAINGEDCTDGAQVTWGHVCWESVCIPQEEDKRGECGVITRDTCASVRTKLPLEEETQPLQVLGAGDVDSASLLPQLWRPSTLKCFGLFGLFFWEWAGSYQQLTDIEGLFMSWTMKLALAPLQYVIGHWTHPEIISFYIKKEKCKSQHGI